MTGTLSPAIPTIGDPNATEDPDIRSALVTLRDGINAVLTASNKLDGAQIAPSTIPSSALTNASIALAKLASGSSAQLIVCNASGVPVYHDLSGDATLSNTGALTIANGAVGPAKLSLTPTYQTGSAGQALTTSYASLVSAGTPNAGTYLVWGTASFDCSLGSDVASLRFSGDTNARTSFGVETSGVALNAGTIFATKTLDGSTALTLQGKSAGTAAVVTHAAAEVAILALRIA